MELSKYKIGDKHISGEVIAFIYGQSPDVIVYEDAKGMLQWEVSGDQLSPTQQAVQQTFDRLEARRSLWIPKGTRSDSKEEMRNALFLALCEDDTSKALAHFDGVRGHIDSELLSQAKISYLRSGFVIAAVMFLVSGALALAANFIALPILEWISLAVLGGAFGSWTSVLQRTPNLLVSTFEVPSWVKFQSTYRVALGVTFGLVALLILKTDLLAPNFLSNTWQFLLVAFISGFSERFIPELLARAERTVSVQYSDKTGTRTSGKVTKTEASNQLPKPSNGRENVNSDAQIRKD